jgi:hypothetical protein
LSIITTLSGSLLCHLFKEMIELANPAAAAALWVSQNDVSAFVMKLFSALRLHVVAAIEAASRKIHINFDGWTTKGSKRGFLGTVAYFATVDRVWADNRKTNWFICYLVKSEGLYTWSGVSRRF